MVVPGAYIVDEDVEISGSISTPRHLYVSGRIFGDARSLDVLIARHGVVDGHIRARTAIIAGHVKGGIEADHVRLLAGCTVEGDVTARTLEVEDGALFEGCVRRRPAIAPNPIARLLAVA